MSASEGSCEPLFPVNSLKNNDYVQANNDGCRPAVGGAAFRLCFRTHGRCHRRRAGQAVCGAQGCGQPIYLSQRDLRGGR
ncbi:hypothetical protein AERO8C_70106 [Aeromonas veronii]|uniref:Uncharacterized protein n=1 Tax=Aeromonas veronii TaxID=654 RepID=A0A653LA44_AERVE|nr:hypothetical protein AERO8C_70106 [Aeromonas veronii]